MEIFLRLFPLRLRIDSLVLFLNFFLNIIIPLGWMQEGQLHLKSEIFLMYTYVRILRDITVCNIKEFRSSFHRHSVECYFQQYMLLNIQYTNTFNVAQLKVM